jgi:UDP-N-acetyl-D-galactosamine dehydrogenase
MAVVGMGYVGMPLALAFAKQADVVGFDINAEKIGLYKQGLDPTGEVGPEEIAKTNVRFSSDESDLDGAAFFVVAVPTPVNPDESPDLEPILSASRVVGRHLSPGSLVVYESTVYPGVTETVCLPLLEKISGLTCGTDFKVGYSPERINPGDKIHRLENIPKIVSAMDTESLEDVAALYEMIIEAGVHRAGSIKVAEAAKVVENSQRDINIAFVNELAMAFDCMGIDTLEVLEAAGTKWNFLNFRPGLVGGHCIGVDPYYFIYEAKKLGYNSRLLAPGRQINNSVADFIADKAVKLLTQTGLSPKNANVYIFGAAFKEDCPDIRNSKVMNIYRTLSTYGISPKVVDPVADQAELQQVYGESLVPLEAVANADCIIFAVAHSVFRSLSFSGICGMFGCPGGDGGRVVLDVKGVCQKKQMLEAGYRYWRL